jgi:hypothetical protein
MKKMIFLAITLLVTGICATTDVQQVSGVARQAGISAAVPNSSAPLAHILRRRRAGYVG